MLKCENVSLFKCLYAEISQFIDSDITNPAIQPDFISLRYGLRIFFTDSYRRFNEKSQKAIEFLQELSIVLVHVKKIRMKKLKKVKEIIGSFFERYLTFSWQTDKENKLIKRIFEESPNIEKVDKKISYEKMEGFFKERGPFHECNKGSILDKNSEYFIRIQRFRCFIMQRIGNEEAILASVPTKMLFGKRPKKQTLLDHRKGK